MKIAGTLLLLLLSICGQIHAQTQKQDIDLLAKYITSHQFSTEDQDGNGAIWTFMDANDGNNIYKVVPYFGHQAARGLLKSGLDNHAAVRNWMTWYVSHLDTLGRAVNHYYHDRGTADSTVGPNDIDAQDADPALFWILANEYYSATGDKMFFTKAVKTKLEAAEKFIMDNLADKDGLTFASINFAMKYTMDNSELYAGFNALANIEKEVYKDNGRYNLYRTKAGNTQKAITLRLLDPVSGLYRNSANTKTNVTQWYEDGVVALIWPQLCGLDPYTADISAHQRAVLCQNFNEKNGKDWIIDSFIIKKIDPYPWAAVGYAFSMAGDTAHGHKQLGYIIQLFKDPEHASHCNVSEAGWALMHLGTIYKKQ